MMHRTIVTLHLILRTRSLLFPCAFYIFYEMGNVKWCWIQKFRKIGTYLLTYFG